MRRLLVLCVSTWSVILATAQVVLAQSYLFSPLDYPGAGFTAAVAINANGEIVGVYGNPPGPPYVEHGFLFTGERFSPIDYPESLLTRPYGINVRGEIVGVYADAEGNAHGFRFLSQTPYLFASVEGVEATNTYLRGINDTGTVVGDADGHGLVWRGLKVHTLNYPGAVQSVATGINLAGDIVGYYEDPQGTRHGFLWRRHSVPQFLTIDHPEATTTGALGEAGTEVHGINRQGQLVGVFYKTPVGDAHGFVLTLQGLHFETVDYPGAAQSEVNGINDAGQIVGDYMDRSGTHGYVATPLLFLQR